MQNALPLTKQEQAYLDKIIDKLSKKSKVSDTQNLILQLNKKIHRTDLENQKLRLLLKAEKIREDDLKNKRQLQATLKAEQEQANQLEQRKENTIGKKIIYAIRENILLDKDYSCTKLLKNMNKQNLFSEEEQELLAEFLVEPDDNFVNSAENHTHTEEFNSDENKMTTDSILQNVSHQINQTHEVIDKNSNVAKELEDSQTHQSDTARNVSQSEYPSAMSIQSTVSSDNQSS